MLSIFLSLIFTFGYLFEDVSLLNSLSAEDQKEIFAALGLKNISLSATSNVCINGNVFSNGNCTVSSINSNINGTHTENKNYKFNDFYEELFENFSSQSNIIEYNDNYIESNVNININNDIFVNGSTNLEGNININSDCISTYDVNFSGRVENSSSITLCSRSGDINIDSTNVNLNGFIYAPYGNINITSSENVSINGVIIANEINIQAQSININYNDSVFSTVQSYLNSVNGKKEIAISGDLYSNNSILSLEWISKQNGDKILYYSEDDINYIIIDTFSDDQSYSFDSSVISGDLLFFKMICDTEKQKYKSNKLTYIRINNEFYLDSDLDKMPDIYELNIIYSNLSNSNIENFDVSLIRPDDDLDGDTLKNYDEYKLGTSPVKADTDGDGLNDNDEISVYFTNPLLYDTDQDSFGDGAEILNGLNPLKMDSDDNGINDGDERIENQILSDYVYKNLDFNETKITPSISITGSGDYSAIISCEDSFQDKTFSELNYLSGHIIEIKHPDSMQFESANISFTLDDSIINNHSIDEFEILRFEPLTGEVIPVETTIDSDNKISANVSELCYYGVANIYDRYKETDINNEGVIVQSGKADLIFVIDTTGSMDDEINDVKNNINSFVENLYKRDVDVRLGLVEFRNVDTDLEDSTKQHGWFKDVES